jgi:type II secretory pathway component PulF
MIEQSERVDQGTGIVKRRSFAWVPVAVVVVAIALMIGLSTLIVPSVSYAQVTQPTPDPYVLSMEFAPVSEDAIADTATAVFSAYANVVWLTGGIALGFYALRRARALLR